MPESRGFSPQQKIHVSFYLSDIFSWLNLILFSVSHCNKRWRNETWMANSDLDKRIIVPLYYFLHHKVVLRFFFSLYPVPVFCHPFIQAVCSQPVYSLPSTLEIWLKLPFFLCCRLCTPPTGAQWEGFSWLDAAWCGGRWVLSVSNTGCASACPVLPCPGLCDTVSLWWLCGVAANPTPSPASGVSGQAAPTKPRDGQGEVLGEVVWAVLIVWPTCLNINGLVMSVQTNPVLCLSCHF